MLNDILQQIMILEWKEGGHEAQDHQASQNPECINALRYYGLLKLFRTIRLKAQVQLLPYLIGLCDVDPQIFIINSQELEIKE